MTSATQRLERSKQLKAQREYNFLYKNYLNEQKQEEKRIKLAEEITKQKQEEVENAGVLERFGYTVLDTITELGGGLLKLGEGLVDAGAGIAGGIGWLLGADTQWAEDFIKYDWTQENYYGAFEDELTSKSYWNDATLVKDVIRGVGQALPTIALVVAAPFTGGATLAGVPFTIGATIASAGGTGMEEALNDGAEFEEAFAYGVMQAGIEGAVEFATAGMGKGITSIGKSVGKNIGKSVTKSVGKTIVEEGISEGVEEGLSALLNPLTKTTYKGAEALEVYKDMSFYLDAGQQALVGAVVGGISAGSGGIVNQKYYGGKTNYNIVQSAQEIATLDIKENNLWKNGKLDAKALQEIQNQRQIELENISSQLMAMSEAERVKALEKLKSKKIDITNLFNEDGSINYENTQNWAVSENETQVLENIQNTKRKPLATDNIEAYSPSLRNKVVEFAPTSNPISENIKTAKNTIMAINPNAKVVIAEDLPVGNAFYDPNSKILYLSNKANSVEVGGHEITHSLEGTKEYKALKDYVLSQVENLDTRMAELIERYKEVNKEAKQGENGEAIARYEAETEIVAEEMGKLLSDQASIDRIVKQNKSVASRIIQWIKDAIAKLTKRGIKGEYYNYLRTAEKLYAKAIKTSLGGVSLAQGTFWDMYYELAKQEEYSSNDKSNNNEIIHEKLVEARYSQKLGYNPEISISTNNIKEHFDIQNINNVNEVVKKVSSKLEDTFLTTPDKQKFVKNIDTGIELTITKAGIKETFGNKKYYLDYNDELKIAKIATMEHLAKLIKYGEVRSKSASNYHNPNSTTKFTYLQAPITIDGVEYNVTMDIKETQDGNRFYIHGINIKKEPNSTPYGESKSSTFIGSNQVPTNNTISQNTDAVNNYYDNNQKKDTRYSLKDNQGNTLSPEQAEFFKDSKVRDYDGNLKVIYHGTNADFFVFDRNRMGKGTDQFGAGYYFAESKEAAQSYGNRVIDTYLNITNPIVINRSMEGGDLYDITITKEQAYKILKEHPKMYDAEESPLGDFSPEYWDVGVKDYMIREMAEGYLNIGLLDGDRAAFRNYPNELHEAIRKVLGYDGIEVRFDNTDKCFYVAWFENQIKEVTNKVPTLSEDIRFSLQEKELTKGQVKKEQAKGYKTKVYDKQEADRIVNNLLEMIQNDSYYAEIKGKTKAELVDYLWIQLNSKDEGYRGEVALKVADYLIDNAIMQDYYQDYANQDNIHTLDVLREYLHKVDLSAIKGEIKHRFDKDNSPYLMWGARKGANGLPADVIAQELAEEGISISATNEADIFFEMHDLYKHALSEMKNNSKVTSAKDVLGKSEVEKLRQDIAREVLMSYDKYGKKTKFAEYIEKSQKRLKTLRTKFADYRAFEQAQKGLKATLNSLKNKFEDKASWKVSEDVKTLVDELVKLESYKGNVTKEARNNLRKVGKHLEVLYGFDKKDNSLYGELKKQEVIEFYDIINELTDSTKEETKFTTEEILDISNVLRNFMHVLQNYNIVSFNGEKVEIDKIAEQGVKELKQAEGLLKGLDKNRLHLLRNSIYANPVDRMAEMGLYRKNSVFMQIYRDMLNGDSKRAKFVMEANMLFDDFYKRNKNYNNVLQEQMFINNGYEDITLHKRQALSLYLTSLRPQGRSHIFGVDGYEGVVKLLDNKLSTRGEMKKALDKGVEIKVTEEMLSNIEKQFTQADREYIELVKTFFNKNSREAKQEVDIALYGVSNVEDGDYFPLKVSSDELFQETTDKGNMNQSVLNFGFNKTTKPNSSNMIAIDGVDNILADHIRKMSLYSGYALPLNAYNKIMNRKVMLENGLGMNMHSATGKIDSGFKGYMEKLWLDVQGLNTKNQKSVDKFFGKLMSRIRWATANSALGLNPKVLLTQTLSLASAQTEFNPKYIVKGMKHFFGEKEKQEMAKYAPLMWERNLVGSSVDVQDIRQVGKEISGKVNKIFAKTTEGLNKLTTAPISWMDSNVIQSLWFASQYEVVETKGLEFGTEANKVEAGKRLTEVVFKTQQTSDALGRSEWMRSDNELIKFGRMFTGDAIQLAGRLISSINKYHLAKAMIKSGDIELSQQGQELLSSAKTGLAKAGSAFILNQVMLLAIAMAFKWLKGKDDDEEWGEIAKNEAMANMIGLLPFGGDIADLMLGYEPTNMAYTSLTNTFNIITETGEIIGTIASGGYQDETKLRASIRKSVLNGSRLIGIPAQNLESYTMGVIGKISPATKEEYEALFKTKSTQAYLDKVEKALANGDEEYADRIINIMFDSRTGKIKDDKVMEVTRDLIEQGYDVLPRVVNKSITYEGVEYTLTDKRHKQFTKIYSQANESVKKMVNLKAFTKIDDEAKAKAMNFIYNYYYNLAIEDMLGEDLESKTILFAEAIPIEQLAMAISQAQVYTADTDKKGVTISGSRKAKIQSYINSLGLTAVQKYMIMGYLGYTNKYGEAHVKSYINRLKLTKSQKEKLFEMSGY